MTAKGPKPEQGGTLFYYGWFIVAAGIVVYSLGYGARYSFSVIFSCLLEEFRWPRDTTAAMLSAHILVYGLVAPVAGHLVDRVGPRKTMLGGTMLLALGLVLSAFAQRPWHFYLTFGVLTGSGLCLTGAVPFTSVLRNWFERRRGLAFSFLFFGAGAAFAFYPVVALLIERFNWRNTFLVEGATVALILCPLVLFVVRYHPSQKGLVVDGAKADQVLPTTGFAGGGSVVVDHAWAAVDWTLAKAVKTRRFWLLCLSTFSLWGIMQHVMVAHHVAFAEDAGYSRMYASSILSLVGVFFALGSLSALVSDRIGREITCIVGAASCLTGIVVLSLVHDAGRPWMLAYYAVSMGFGLGMTSPTIAAAVTDIFQGPRVGAVIGFVWFSFAMGGTIGPWLGGWIFEWAGSYLSAFVAAMVLCVTASVSIWLASPAKVRRVPGRNRP